MTRDMHTTQHGFDRAPIVDHDDHTAPSVFTPATLARLGEPSPLSELKIVVAGSPFDGPAIERTTRDLAAWL